jgi:anthranilate phosphoribosyltransferase
MKKILQSLFQHEQLSYEQARDLLIGISEGAYNDAQTTAFISVFQMREIALQELQGFRDALLSLCIRPELKVENAIDLCGTGGDGKNSFNISTLSAVVVAAAGYKVVKHGNYGVSSLCGSSNVLEAMGYKFTNDSGLLQEQLDQTNLCFLHAPLFHPAMKSVAGLRKSLGLRTFFNLLGPLVNPLQPSHQLVGVADLKVMRLYHYLLQATDREAFGIVHSLDGFDEVSLTSDYKLIQRSGEQMLSPAYKASEAEIAGGESIEEAAAIFQSVLDGQGSAAQNLVVAANAGLAIHLFEPPMSLETCQEKALAIIESGQAAQTFKQLLKTQEAFQSEVC